MTKRRHKVDRHRKSSPRYLKQLGMVAALVTVLLGFGGFAILWGGGDSIPQDFVPDVIGAPRVAVAQEVFDYGDVKLNTTVETVFEVQNVGDETLTLMQNPQVQVLEGC